MLSRIALLLILTALTACQSDKNPVQRHWGEQVPSAPAPQGTTASNPQPAGVMDESQFRERERTGTVEFRRNLHNYNLALLEKIKKQDTSVAAELARYETRLLAGCDAELLGCTNLKIFRSSSMSAVVVRAIAKTKAEVGAYYRLLMAAFEIKNSTYDHELALLYMRRAQEYAVYLDKQKRPDLLQRHGRTLTTMLADFQSRARPEEVASILEQFDIWSYSRHKPGLLGSSSTLLFNLAAKGFLYVNGQPNPALAKFIGESQAAPDSFTKKAAALRDKSPYLLESIKEGNLPAQDEYFYIVDRLFRGDLGLDDAAALWNASQKDSAKLAKFLNAVLYVELLSTVSTANREMRQFFAKAHDLPTKKLLDETLAKSMELIPLFQSLISRAKIVRDFSSRALQNSKDEGYFKQVSTQYDSLDNNIKFMATYPQMLMLAYHLSKEKFEMKFRFFFFEVTIDSTTIIQQMMAGGYEPWFGYSNNQKAISSMDLMYALYFAFQLDIFSDFQVEPDDFLVMVAKKLTERSTESMRLHAEHIRDTLLRSASYREYLSLCRQANAEGKIDHPISLEDFLERPLLGQKLVSKMDQAGGALNIVGMAGNYSVGKLNEGFYLGSNLTARSFDEMRTDLNPMLFRLRGMTYAYRTVLKQKGLDPAQIKSKLKDVDAYLGYVDELKYNLISYYMEAHRDSGCYYRLQRMDRDRRNSLMTMETEYLRQVHRAMVKLQKEPGLQESLNASLRTDTSALKVQPADRFDAKRFTYSRSDFVARAVNNLMKTEPHARIRFPSDLRATRSEGGAALLTTPLSVTVDFQPDEEAFVNRLLKTHFDPAAEASPELRHAKIRWTSWFNYNGTEPYNFRYERSVLSALNRIGPVKAKDGRVSDSITAQDLVKAVAEEVGYIYQNDTEQKFWAIFGKYRLYDTSYMVDLFISHRNGEATPVFEHLFDMLVSPYLGDRYLAASESGNQSEGTGGIPSQISWQGLAEQYVMSRQYRANFIVPVDPRFDADMDADIRREVLRDMRAPFALEKAVREREKADVANPQNRIRIMPYANQPPRDTAYLEEIQVLDYEARLKEFDKTTGGFFKAAESPSP